MKKFKLLFATVLFNITLHAQNTIVTDTILQLSTCAGGNIIVPFTATGNYPAGNVFTAQLSNAFGQFTTPINIGSVPFNIGLIFATIPLNTNFGFLYKIRVVSSNPSIIGTACPNTLIITQVAQLNQIVAAPNDSICEGDEVTLTALNPAGSYNWSTGDTTQFITVTQAGNYSVTVTDFLMCESDTSITISTFPQPCVTSLEENNWSNISISPNPTAGKFLLNMGDLTLVAEQIKIYNSVGQLQNAVIQNPSAQHLGFDLANLANGIYFVKIALENQIITKTIVKE
ncbi:MAG: T9SS type A sorting domain-containing protein [Crocinitomicaceae bacterium]